MIQGLILLAHGFEQTEALATMDVCLRTKSISIRTVSIEDTREVASSSGVLILAEAKFEDVDVDDFSFVILPGGKAGVERLGQDPRVLSLLTHYAEERKGIFAICAAPSILGNLGLLDGRPYTCFPGFQKGYGAYLDLPAVRSDFIITGHSMGYSLEFGMAIVEYLLGIEAVGAIQPGIKGLR